MPALFFLLVFLVRAEQDRLKMLKKVGQVGVAGICQQLQRLSDRAGREGAGGGQKKTGMARSHPGGLKVKLGRCRLFVFDRRTGAVGSCLLSLADHVADAGCCFFHDFVIKVGVTGRHGLTAVAKCVANDDK